MRTLLLIPVLALGACQVTKSDNETTVEYNQDVAENAGAAEEFPLAGPREVGRLVGGFGLSHAVRVKPDRDEALERGPYPAGLNYSGSPGWIG